MPSCAACGEKIEGRTARAKYCSERCKRRFHRGARASTPSRTKTQSEAKSQDDGRGAIESTEAATLMALSEAKKLGTPGGQAALVLARRIDRSHVDTGAGLASMVKRLQETVAELLADVQADDDPVDELTRRREEKVRAASG